MINMTVMRRGGYINDSRGKDMGGDEEDVAKEALGTWGEYGKTLRAKEGSWKLHPPK